MKLHILQILDRAEGHGLSITTLRTELELVRRAKCGEQELRAALTEMCNSGLTIDAEDDLTGDKVYTLTKAGTARARK